MTENLHPEEKKENHTLLFFPYHSKPFIPQQAIKSRIEMLFCLIQQSKQSIPSDFVQHKEKKNCIRTRKKEKKSHDSQSFLSSVITLIQSNQ